MSVGFICQWCLIVTLIIFVVCAYFTYRNSSMLIVDDLYTKANKDLSYIGSYDIKLANSVRYWSYAIEAKGYSKGKATEIHELLLSWNARYNHDIDGVILKALEDAHTLILSDIDEARKNKEKPRFKYSQKFNMRELPSTMRFNDYIKPECLFEDLDLLLEV